MYGWNNKKRCKSIQKELLNYDRLSYVKVLNNLMNSCLYRKNQVQSKELKHEYNDDVMASYCYDMNSLEGYGDK